jgi:hypothetical protein
MQDSTPSEPVLTAPLAGGLPESDEVVLFGEKPTGERLLEQQPVRVRPSAEESARAANALGKKKQVGPIVGAGFAYLIRIQLRGADPQRGAYGASRITCDNKPRRRRKKANPARGEIPKRS